MEQKLKLSSFKNSELINEKVVGHTAVSATQASSVTLKIWQHEAKENNCKFASFKRVGNTKTSIIQMGPNTLNVD